MGINIENEHLSLEDLLNKLPGIIMDGPRPYFLSIVKDCDLETGEDLWVIKYENCESIIEVTYPDLRHAIMLTLQKVDTKDFKY